MHLMATVPHRPGLIVHTFLPADRPGVDTFKALRELWHAVQELQMDARIGQWRLDPPYESIPYRDGLVVLAARQQVRIGGLYQAVAYRLHDVIGVSVLLAPNDDRIGWPALSARWINRPPQQPDAAMGTVFVHLGLWQRPRGVARWFAPTDPPVPLDEPATETVTWCRMGDDVLLGEVLTTTGGPRRIIALTDPGNEPALDALTWAGAPGLPALTRYLLHAAKVRYQSSVLRNSVGDLQSAIARTESRCETLRSLLDRQDPPIQELIRADRALGAVQTEEHGLIAALADVRDMTETVRVARRNMVSARGRSAGQTGGPFGNDNEIAEWVSDQLRTELTYLESAQLKATALARQAAAVVDGWHQRRRETLTLVQTSVIGALLMALAAVQSFEYHVPLPGGLLAPAIAVLSALALLAPVAITRWPGRDAVTPVQPRRYAAGAAVVGAAAGWLVAGVAWQIAVGTPAPPAGSMVAAGAVAILCAATPLVLSRWWRRRSSAHVEVGSP